MRTSPHQFLEDELTLFKSGADYAHYTISTHYIAGRLVPNKIFYIPAALYPQLDQTYFVVIHIFIFILVH